MIVHDSFINKYKFLRKIFKEAFKQILQLYTKQVPAAYRFWIETFRATDGMLQVVCLKKYQTVAFVDCNRTNYEPKLEMSLGRQMRKRENSSNYSKSRQCEWSDSHR